MSNEQISTGHFVRQFVGNWAQAWNRFWFSTQSPETLGLIRISVGLITLYSHLVWFFNADVFLVDDGVLPESYRQQFFGNPFAWSLFDIFAGGIAGTLLQVLGLVVVGLMTIGLWTRWTSVLTVVLVISYANRGMGALFGLDQIMAFLCLYLALGNSGDAFSVDRQWQSAGAGQGRQPAENVANNLATRLIQIHMCVVYLFAAIGKLQGETWLTGEAIWGALASYEYQTLDMTWLSGHMGLVAILTLGTLAWELGYCALIWPKLTRPIVLALAIPIHLGIGICMGMMTFGFIMLAGNLAFVEPSFTRRLLRSKSERKSA